MTKLQTLLISPLKLLTFIIGRVHWEPPRWIPLVFSLLKKHLKWIGLFAIFMLAGIGIHNYINSLPKDIKIQAELTQIKLTGVSRGAQPSTLGVSFFYDFDSLNEGQIKPSGRPSVARIDLVGKTIESGITLQPAKKGTWKWTNDKSLLFTPETDWPAGTTYAVTFDKDIFTEQAMLSAKQYSFTTPDFSAKFDNTEFYQDPTDSTVRRVVSTISFSHPINKESFEERLKVGMQAKKARESDQLKSHDFSVTYSQNLREAYVSSAPITLPDEPNYMKLVLEKGLRSLLGGSESRHSIDSKVLIPDIYSYLRVTDISSEIVRNAENEPEQLVMLEFTDEVDQQELLSKLSAYQLDKRLDTRDRNRTARPRLIQADDLSKSKKLNIKLIPNQRNSSKSYSFVIDVPERQDIYVLVEENLTSVNKFIQASAYDDVIRAPAYPAEISIAGEGALLTHTGNHQLSVLTRGVSALKYSVGKLVDGQINHLVSQTRGDITNPSFSTRDFSQNDITEHQSKVVELEASHPKQANYSSFDLTQYLPNDKSQFGLFFVQVSGWDKHNERETYPKDKRLILVTDLGIIVKNNADHSHHVFVQSIANGEPVAGASVQLLGKNGLALSTVTTDERGHAFFAPTFGYEREKTPTVYVVKTASDVSFIPFQRAERQINLSKFDIGGVRANSNSGVSLSGFVFSDRGIYRPGETVNLGLLVKNEDLSNVEGVPLELVIYGPRNSEAEVNRYTLPKMGFSDFQFSTEPTSDTGRYSASLHLISDRGRRGRQIGSTEFKVEEFQPDSMKILSQLQDTSETGWNTADNVSASVTLSNLFGTPAQDRKITARA